MTLHSGTLIIRGERATQPTSSGLGKQFTSPKKRRSKAKTQTFVQIPGHARKRQRLLEKLALLNRDSDDEEAVDRNVFENSTLEEDPDPPRAMTPEVQPDNASISLTPATLPSATPTMRRILPDHSTERLYSSWKTLVTTLVQGYLTYTAATTGTATQASEKTISSCAMPTCDSKVTSITALYFDQQ
ncbi:hypothetical protein BJ138DRAFT_931137 [Hygrophoropsis aurantiaca]|uniref:Uncharacterized protein n=1 Tax=Hygrophoropsis aurantiaca TaxID=72124 RepID=A0ACB7ZTE7_9AGAM|nr:hypothetical protein BJ138DRAFT_931137 [Hygrophoropsis aurantiaca]